MVIESYAAVKAPFGKLSNQTLNIHIMHRSEKHRRRVAIEGCSRIVYVNLVRKGIIWQSVVF